MVSRLRAAKVAGALPAISDRPEVSGPSPGDILMLGWGSTRGAIHGAGIRLRAQGHQVSTAHLRWLNPLPSDLADVLAKFKQIIVPELNLGQLAFILRAKTLVDIKSICKVQGQPFREQEIIEKVLEITKNPNASPFVIDVLEGRQPLIHASVA